MPTRRELISMYILAANKILYHVAIIVMHNRIFLLRNDVFDLYIEYINK